MGGSGGSCGSCRHAHVERREKIVGEGIGTLAEFSDELEAWYFCRAPTRVGKEIGRETDTPLNCPLHAAAAPPDVEELDALDAKIAAAAERWARKDAKDRERW
jgi:hypothetical protein